MTCLDNLPVLGALVEKCQELSQSQGFASYAHFFLVDRIAKTTERMHNFLGNVGRGQAHRGRAIGKMLEAQNLSLYTTRTCKGTNTQTQPGQGGALLLSQQHHGRHRRSD